jgi:hypothetical protein
MCRYVASRPSPGALCTSQEEQETLFLVLSPTRGSNDTAL